MSIKYKIVLIIAPGVFILDQITKWIIRSNIRIGDGISVIPGFFDIIHVTNKGAAFGMFSGASSSFRIPFFYSVSAIATIIMITTIIKLQKDDKFLSLVFALILGGIGGNIIDRIRLGSVTDFLSVHIQDKVIDSVIFGYHLNFRLDWPAFNVADSAISVAMVLLIWSLFKTQDQKSNIKDTCLPAGRKNTNQRDKNHF